jgi:hypothetical protein
MRGFLGYALRASLGMTVLLGVSEKKARSVADERDEQRKRVGPRRILVALRIA